MVKVDWLYYGKGALFIALFGVVMVSLAFVNAANSIRGNLDAYVDYSVSRAVGDGDVSFDGSAFCDEVLVTPAIEGEFPLHTCDKVFSEDWLYRGVQVREYDWVCDEWTPACMQWLSGSTHGYAQCGAIFLDKERADGFIQGRITLLHEYCHITEDYGSLEDEERACYLYSTDLGNFLSSFIYQFAG